VYYTPYSGHYLLNRRTCEEIDRNAWLSDDGPSANPDISRERRIPRSIHDLPAANQ